MEEIKNTRTYDLQIQQGKKIIAHASCNFANNEVQIRDLYVLHKFRGKGLGDLLLSKVLDYAAERNASKVIAYCGAEPFCAGGQIPLDLEVSWYEEHGFYHDHDVMGVTPCMVKELEQVVV